MDAQLEKPLAKRLVNLTLGIAKASTQITLIHQLLVCAKEVGVHMWHAGGAEPPTLAITAYLTAVNQTVDLLKAIPSSDGELDVELDVELDGELNGDLDGDDAASSQDDDLCQ